MTDMNVHNFDKQNKVNACHVMSLSFNSVGTYADLPITNHGARSLFRNNSHTQIKYN